MASAGTGGEEAPLTFEQVNQLKAKRADIEDEMRAWVGAHPELRRLTSDLVAAVLQEKPEDPIVFAKEWIAAMDATGGADAGGETPATSRMCFKTTCPSCGKATWSGCGAHIDSALRGVPESDRCAGWKTGVCTGGAAAASSAGARRGPARPRH